MILKEWESKEQELEQSEDKSHPQNKNGKYLKIQIDNTQWKQMAYRVGSYFPKGGHSTTQTELKV